MNGVPGARRRPDQLPLGVSLRRPRGFSNFIVGPNAGAVAVLRDLLAGRVRGVVYLWGGSGSGKSHLLEACCGDASVQGRPVAYLPLSERRRGLLFPQVNYSGRDGGEVSVSLFVSLGVTSGQSRKAINLRGSLSVGSGPSTRNTYNLNRYYTGTNSLPKPRPATGGGALGSSIYRQQRYSYNRPGRSVARSPNRK